MKTIFVTGGTGAVGTPLVRALLARGDRVLLLARDPARAAALFDHHPGLVVFAGDVLFPLGGISRSEIARWRGQVDTFVHGAAIIQFHWGMLEQTKAVNIQGTAHMLELSEELAARRFFHVSTAYVGGTCDVLFESEWGDPRHAENPYELTKQAAEQLVAQGSPEKNHILRLSIVIGDANTGVTAGFDGYYGFVQSILGPPQAARQSEASPAPRRRESERDAEPGHGRMGHGLDARGRQRPHAARPGRSPDAPAAGRHELALPGHVH